MFKMTLNMEKSIMVAKVIDRLLDFNILWKLSPAHRI